MKNILNIIGKLNFILTSKQKRAAIMVLILSFFGALVETLGISAMMPFIQIMVSPEQILANDKISKIVNVLGIQGTDALFYIFAFGIVLVYILKNIYLCILSYVRVAYATKVQKELSIYMFRSYMNRGYDFFRKNNTAQLLRGTTSSVAGVYNLINHGMKIISEILTAVCIGMFIFMTDPQMTFSVCVLLLISLLIVLKVFKKTMQEAGNRYFSGVSETNKWALQLFSGIKEILVLNRKEYFLENFEHAYKEQQEGQIRQTVAAEIPAYIIEGTCVGGMIIAICIRMFSVNDALEFLPELAAFAVAAFRLLPSVGRISSSYNNCVFSLPSLEEVYNNYLEANKNITIGEGIKEAKEVKLTKCMNIKDIEWKYSDGNEKILDKINLKINKGESIAFIGSSGSGKSTLIDIILGLFKPQKGKIFIDDLNCYENNISFENLVGYVPQSVYMIDDTIRNNVAFGIKKEEISEEKVWLALEQAQLASFVKNLPQGLDTIIGERGVRFSGGQSQRMAIARALYCNPEILILDEATSALDAETETAVMKAVDALHGKKTLIIIAHRLETLKNCNKIYEIKNGKIFQREYTDLINLKEFK